MKPIVCCEYFRSNPFSENKVLIQVRLPKQRTFEFSETSAPCFNSVGGEMVLGQAFQEVCIMRTELGQDSDVIWGLR